MNITRNGEPLDTQGLAGLSTIVEIVSALAKKFGEEGQVILKVHLDNRPLSLDELPSENLVPGSHLEMTTDSLEAVALYTTNEALNQLPGFSAVIDQIIEDLIKGEKNTAFKRFSELMKEFHALIQIMQTLHGTLHYKSCDNKELVAQLETLADKMMNILSEVKSAMHQDDLVSLTDLIEYEIKVLFEEDLKTNLQNISSFLSKV